MYNLLASTDKFLAFFSGKWKIYNMTLVVSMACSHPPDRMACSNPPGREKVSNPRSDRLLEHFYQWGSVALALPHDFGEAAALGERSRLHQEKGKLLFFPSGSISGCSDSGGDRSINAILLPSGLVMQAT